MSKYAKINSDNIVENIIVCDDSQVINLEGEFIKVTDSTGVAIVSGLYNRSANKFIKNKPYDSWVLGDDFEWHSPIGDHGSDGIYQWNEENGSWDKLVVGNIQPSEDHIWDEESQEWIIP